MELHESSNQNIMLDAPSSPVQAEPEMNVEDQQEDFSDNRPSILRIKKMGPLE